MLAYSALLTLALLLSSPWWVVRMLTTERYREGLAERLGRVPTRLIGIGQGQRPASCRVIWVHAVSVGEVLAATRLVQVLEAALQDKTPRFEVVVSTTTRTGQALARERFGAERVFYMPLDFAWAVRRYLPGLRPAMLVLMESELWPRMLHECARAGIPVAVVNARVSDRSFRRGLRVRRVWRRVLNKPSLWLAQSEEDARRLILMGARAHTVKVTGNLKFDIRAPRQSRLAELIREAAGSRPVIVAGSTVEGEDDLVLAAFHEIAAAAPGALLVIAPRHPERFKHVLEAAEHSGAVYATSLLEADPKLILQPVSGSTGGAAKVQSNPSAVVLNTIGDLAAMYAIAAVAFVGGSIVDRGGHNPLEPAQFGVPIFMGPSFQNFRGIVENLRAADAIRVLGGQALSPAAAAEAANRDAPNALREELSRVVIKLLENREAAKAMGERGRRVFEEQQGATTRTVAALMALLEHPRETYQGAGQ